MRALASRVRGIDIVFLVQELRRDKRATYGGELEPSCGGFRDLQYFGCVCKKDFYVRIAGVCVKLAPSAKCVFCAGLDPVVASAIVAAALNT
ncbi:hypothetical protein EVAR_19445_1 [Eumeta japonica]|uniref:Uncharacterized protein n=1 Tax=Eumeta variegata TaxID=151549 RepID=A0A4C1TRZ5_EUMVA|nr:hypothetical protein EVAR_19445_1 [Eumeta japonica]